MEIIEKKSDEITFIIKIEDSLANAVRRYINRVPILAVEYVDIHKNDSPLFDETIAHRIGLIPLKLDKKPKESDSYELKLEVTGEPLVYSGDLKGKIKPAYDKIPITTLNKNQSLNVVAKVAAGFGEEHSKYSPGLMFYRHLFEI